MTLLGFPDIHSFCTHSRLCFLERLRTLKFADRHGTDEFEFVLQLVDIFDLLSTL